MIRKGITVKGTVQGVGFRPFVYRIALENQLSGWVNNTSKGVVMEIQGDEVGIKNFLTNLKERAPELSSIEEVVVENKKSLKDYKEFLIVKSTEEKGRTLISPDIATCKECEKELRDSNNPRRYLYPFINCTNCGPRFSIIKDTPYDRKYTSMDNFIMCDKCKEEYENPNDRRFHAEPTCCSACGPRVILLDNKGNPIKSKDEFESVRKYLKEGKIIGIKGIGGFNLVCDGNNELAIEKLRHRKHRPDKALALMMKNINVVEKYCYVNSEEKEILTGNKKPILLLKKKNNKLPTNISFNNKRLGVVLPYSPLHYLIFDNDIDTLVFTSGNLSTIPIIYEDIEAIDNLREIVDYFFIHNREINMPVDDSVVQVIGGYGRVIRAGRGYAPYYNKYIFKENILALGSQFKNSFSLGSGDCIFTSPYIGDMDGEENYLRFNRVLKHMKNIFRVEPSTIIHDMHPNYWSKDYLDKNKVRTLGVYHHHSHIVSCMIENKENDKVIGIAFDGVGYGEDGNLWGGEFLICDKKNFFRGAHLKYIPLPGGDGAVKFPGRIGLSLLLEALKEDEIEEAACKYFYGMESRIIINMLRKNFNCPLTSSMGRLFDGIASLLDFNKEVSYEGEAAMYVQCLAEDFIDSLKGTSDYDYIKRCENRYHWGISDSLPYIININNMIRDIIKDLDNNIDKGCIALKFHNTIIDFSNEICIKLREEYRINKVALSGGVFQNSILLDGIEMALKESGFQVITHRLIPCNDGGLSIGQIVIGNELCKEN